MATGRDLGVSSKDRYLIILRGVPGSGKTQIALRIVRSLGGEATRKDLDGFAPESEQAQFEMMIEDALEYRYVVAELYSGKKHSSEPFTWLARFKENYECRVFVLRVSEEKGFERCSDPRHTSWTSPTREQYHEAYQKFEGRLTRKEFESKTGLKESSVDVEAGDWDRIASEVLGLAGLNRNRAS